jgi:hypothetical protein
MIALGDSLPAVRGAREKYLGVALPMSYLLAPRVPKFGFYLPNASQNYPE